MAIPDPSPLDCRSVLALGGARSGKSRWAQALAEGARARRLVIATAEAGDEEMEARIARHRADRGEGWTTREEPLELARALREEAREDRVALVDCVTLWLSNLMFAGRALDREIRELVEAIGALAGPVIFVSNEGLAGAREPGDRRRVRRGRSVDVGDSDADLAGPAPEPAAYVKRRQ